MAQKTLNNFKIVVPMQIEATIQESYHADSEIEYEVYYIKTNAKEEDVRNAIRFVNDKDINKVIQALRLLGFKVVPISLDYDAVIHMN